MKFLFLLIFLITTSTLSGCMDSEKMKIKQKIIKRCTETEKNLDIFLKDGTHISNTDEGKDFSFVICNARANLYIKGYRISQSMNNKDYRVYQLDRLGTYHAEDIYLKLIEQGVEP